MQYPSWASTRSNLSYRRRTPEQSVLYRLVYHYRDELVRRWDELFAQKYGYLRPEVLEAFDKYLNCGIFRFGAARAYCDSCKHSVLVAFSCKCRGVCDSCAAKRAVLFAENLHTNVLLHYPHRHLVFTLPKRLRVYFRYERGLLSGLYKAAWESVKESFACEFPKSNPGGVFSLHTSGALPSWHPHLHCIVLDGVIDAGEFKPSVSLESERLETCFSKKVLTYLECQGLVESEMSESILGQTNTGFSVYVGEPVSGDDENARLFLSRYLKKSSINGSCVSIDESGGEPKVIYTARMDDGQERSREYHPLEFLAELSLHIPKTFEQTTRFYGVYSCRSRGAARVEEKLSAEDSVDEAGQCNLLSQERPVKASSSWARCMKQVFEINPLCCPKCGEEMRIVAFIHSSHEIERIATNLGYTTWRAPPRFGSKGHWVDYSAEYSQLP